MRLLILCGGRGTRLQSAVGDVPKALAPINNIPFLRIQLDNWRRQGILKFDFLLGYKSDMIARFLEQEKRRLKTLGQPVQFNHVTETEPLDTGGAIANAIDQLGITKEFLTINADTWLSGGINDIRLATPPTIGIVGIDNPQRFGMVTVDEQLTVTAFIEKGSTPSDRAWINSGISKLTPDIFSGWSGERLSLEREIFPELISQARLRAIRLNTQFIDIGIPEDYLRFCKKFEEMSE